MREPASPGARTGEGAAHRAPLRIFAASSNAGKLGEYRDLAADSAAASALDLGLLPHFAELPEFEENAHSFAENAAGKALHYSRFADLPVLADDSGLVVDALGGAPGVLSARYAGPGASDAQRTAKLLGELQALGAADRRARFVCVLALAERERPIAIVSAEVEGQIIDPPRGAGGFGYDPVFFLPALGKTFAELSAAEKNHHSHRGKAFRKLLEFVARTPML